MKQRFLLLLAFTALALPSQAEDAKTMLKGAHAHNDYEHPRPLLDALSHGFQSVEADIFLVDGQLLVAHDRDKVSAERTLEKLYLDPLQERVRQNDGHVYPNASDQFFLLIDIKSQGEETYRALHSVLLRYRDMLVETRDDRTLPGAVQVIISGNRPRALLKSLQPRLATYDGRLKDLSDSDARWVPLISDNWRLHFRWRGKGPLPDTETTKLKKLVREAHDKGQRIRFWAIPDNEAAWKVMHEHGVDFINTDRLAELSAFLTGL